VEFLAEHKNGGFLVFGEDAFVEPLVDALMYGFVAVLFNGKMRRQ
jgi:hypothetical protein